MQDVTRIFLYSLSLAIVLTALAFCQQAVAQAVQDVNAERRFSVGLNKQSYLPLEPIVVEFSATLRAGDKRPSFMQETTVTLISESEVKELGPIDPTSERPTLLPESRQLMDLGRPTAATVTFDSIGTIGSGILFPSEPGIYQLQFFLHTANQRLASDVLRITIEIPKGDDLKAFKFLEGVKADRSFDWVWKEKDGVASLKRFIEEFRETPYADYATLYLGIALFAKDELAAAKEQLDKVSEKGNSYLSEQAKKMIEEIEKRKNRENQSREPK